MKLDNSFDNVSNLFARLIGYLNLIIQLDSYKENHKDYSEILNLVENYAIKYIKVQNLSFIKNEELIYIYEKADELQTKYICSSNINIGEESEFSDYVVNLLCDLRIIYKKNFERKK